MVTDSHLPYTRNLSAIHLLKKKTEHAIEIKFRSDLSIIIFFIILIFIFISQYYHYHEFIWPQ